MKNKIVTILLCLFTAVSITGCGGVVQDDTSSKQLVTDKNSEYSYLEGMKSGEYYILHADYTYEPLYFNEASFDKGNVATTPNSNRVVWFKDDMLEIPYFRASAQDQLIYYTPDTLEEEFNWERFENMGYSLGIRGLKKTKTNRYTLSTNKDDKTLYPRSDADEILNLANEEVFVETLGTEKVRANVAYDGETGEKIRTDNIESELVTRAGTFKGLEQGMNYNIEIYDGTIKNTYNLRADVDIFASWECYKTINYDFIYDNVIKIDLPKIFESGLYMIDGQGLFFFVKDSDNDEIALKNTPTKTMLSSSDYESYTSIALQNIEREKQEKEDLEKKNFEENYDALAPDKNANDGFVSEFDIEEPGNLSIKVTFKNGGDGEKVTAVLGTPSGGYIELDNQDDGSLTLTFSAEKGHYVIEYINLGTKEPVVGFE